MIRTDNRLAGLLAALTVLALLLLPATAQAAEGTPEAETAFIEAINAARAEEGLAPLAINHELTEIARAWSGEMDAAGQLHHNPHYSSQYSGDWNRMGENVGYATSAASDALAIVPRLHRAFMDSPGHRANILGDYNQVGVGVVMTGGTLWVTVNFLQGPLVEAPAPADVIVVPESPAPLPNHFTRR